MRSKLFQALLGCTARATRPRFVQVACALPPQMMLMPSLPWAPLTPFVREAHTQSLVMRAAILSQARYLHLTPALCKKKKKKTKDDCSGQTQRRRGGRAKPCPPPPKKCPPPCPPIQIDTDCDEGFGAHKKKKPRKH